MGRDDGWSVTVWWLGARDADEALLRGVCTHLEAEFRTRVVLQNPGERPTDTFDPRRRQHGSRAYLQWLIARAPQLPHRVLGLTDVDLFMPVLTFVFGEAQLDGPAAVVSTARLSDPDAGVTLARVRCEAVHELGHTFGLLHCDALQGTGRRARRCVMTRSASVRAVDEKSGHLCPDCRTRFEQFHQDGSHVYREHENPHR